MPGFFSTKVPFLLLLCLSLSPLFSNYANVIMCDPPSFLLGWLKLQLNQLSWWWSVRACTTEQYVKGKKHLILRVLWQFIFADLNLRFPDLTIIEATWYEFLAPLAILLCVSYFLALNLLRVSWALKVSKAWSSEEDRTGGMKEQNELQLCVPVCSMRVKHSISSLLIAGV